VARGEALVEPGTYAVSYRLDVVLRELEPIADGARLQVHLGTAHVLARVARVGERHAQLRLAERVVAARGDRVVLRGETTVGGGVVLDPLPPRHRSVSRMELVERGDVAATVEAPVRVESLRFLLEGELDDVVRAGDWVFSAEWLAALEEELRSAIAEADPLDPGVPVPASPWAGDVVPLLSFERRGAKLYLPGAVPTLDGRSAEADSLERQVASAGMQVTKLDDGELARFLARSGRIVPLGEGHAIGVDAYDVARDVLLTECRATGEITLARFRDLVGTGRRDAQLLLERFDADGLTRRVGDRRVLRRARSRAT
jgi:selenocysteine-specific elongation factor